MKSTGSNPDTAKPFRSSSVGDRTTTYEVAMASGERGVHDCGAYWGYGFHEDGVASALRVCERCERTLA